MGDNLKAASRFVSQSMTSLDHLLSTDSLSQTAVFDQLSDLQRGAKAMRARAIYRAAQTAVDMLHKGQAEDKVQSELSVVRSLVQQYKTGLDEVLHETAPMSAPVNSSPQLVETAQISPPDTRTIETPVNDMIADLYAQLTMDMMQQETQMPDESLNEAIMAADMAPLTAARSHLEPLIDFAPDAEQRDALRRLSRLHGQANDAASEDARKTKPRQSAVEFETLMPELTNVVLTRARHLGKTVSISYAANGVRIGPSLAETLRPALVDLCALLVSHSLEAPNLRRERGESGAGHVSIIAGLNSGKLQFSAECTGRDIDPEKLEIPSWQTLSAAGGELRLGRDGDRFCVTMSGLPVYLHTSHANAAKMLQDLEQAS